MLAIRKYDERAKGDDRRVNGALPHGRSRYAIVDDFVCTGETVEHIFHCVRGRFPNALLSGVILYRCRADVEGDSYSYVDSTRADIARHLDEVWVTPLRIHARPADDWMSVGQGSR